MAVCLPQMCFNLTSSVTAETSLWCLPGVSQPEVHAADLKKEFVMSLICSDLAVYSVSDKLIKYPFVWVLGMQYPKIRSIFRNRTEFIGAKRLFRFVI